MIKVKNLSCTKIIVHGETLLKSVSAEIKGEAVKPLVEIKGGAVKKTVKEERTYQRIIDETVEELFTLAPFEEGDRTVLEIMMKKAKEMEELEAEE